MKNIEIPYYLGDTKIVKQCHNHCVEPGRRLFYYGRKNLGGIAQNEYV